ncbi:DUF3048 domain-containing protein [Candidatus Saccharibacteria bacterium]|nr:DUF3048 domain-containing protein [Candidatus Saccharibacteria bacterium]
MSKKNSFKAKQPAVESTDLHTSQTFNKIKPPIVKEDPVKKKHRKVRIIVLVVLLLLTIAICSGVAVYFLVFKKPVEPENSPEPEKAPEAPKIYSKLSGLEIKDESENNAPIYCIQTPNGADGARPQVGLNEAPVVFEAVAEAGITRFAAIYQNPKSKAIGPIRSLRSYYYDWDVPFDCIIVHAGGAPSAIAELNRSGYRHLNESAVYMWRDYSAYYAPNNLFTSPDKLSAYSRDMGYNSSDPKVLPRLTPDEAKEISDKNIDASKETNDEDSEVVPLVSNIQVNFGGVATFNTVYTYNEETNTYARAYASGEEHLVYNCADSDKAEPHPKQDCGTAIQITPSAVAVMMVDERKDSDGYHEFIQTIGTGNAYIFQNGAAVKGLWKKTSQNAQIEFTDMDGHTISFTPGQLWIAAVSNSVGNVKY